MEVERREEGSRREKKKWCEVSGESRSREDDGRRKNGQGRREGRVGGEKRKGGWKRTWVRGRGNEKGGKRGGGKWEGEGG